MKFITLILTVIISIPVLATEDIQGLYLGHYNYDVDPSNGSSYSLVIQQNGERIEGIMIEESTENKGLESRSSSIKGYALGKKLVFVKTYQDTGNQIHYDLREKDDVFIGTWEIFSDDGNVATSGNTVLVAIDSKPLADLLIEKTK